MARAFAPTTTGATEATSCWSLSSLVNCYAGIPLAASSFASLQHSSTRWASEGCWCFLLGVTLFLLSWSGGHWQNDLALLSTLWCSWGVPFLVFLLWQVIFSMPASGQDVSSQLSLWGKVTFYYHPSWWVPCHTSFGVFSLSREKPYHPVLSCSIPGGTFSSFLMGFLWWYMVVPCSPLRPLVWGVPMCRYPYSRTPSSLVCRGVFATWWPAFLFGIWCHHVTIFFARQAPPHHQFPQFFSRATWLLQPLSQLWLLTLVFQFLHFFRRLWRLHLLFGQILSSFLKWRTQHPSFTIISWNCFIFVSQNSPLVDQTLL